MALALSRHLCSAAIQALKYFPFWHFQVWKSLEWRPMSIKNIWDNVCIADSGSTHCMWCKWLRLWCLPGSPSCLCFPHGHWLCLATSMWHASRFWQRKPWQTKPLKALFDRRDQSYFSRFSDRTKSRDQVGPRSDFAKMQLRSRSKCLSLQCFAITIANFPPLRTHTSPYMFWPLFPADFSNPVSNIVAVLALSLLTTTSTTTTTTTITTRSGLSLRSTSFSPGKFCTKCDFKDEG